MVHLYVDKEQVEIVFNAVLASTTISRQVAAIRLHQAPDWLARGLVRFEPIKCDALNKRQGFPRAWNVHVS